jgi:hypothetical protein
MKDSGKRAVIGLLSTKRKIKTAPISEAGVINAWAFLSFAQTEKNRRPEEDGEKAH